MGDFSKNPKEPFEVRVPKKIRKRIAMHETDRAFARRKLKATLLKRIATLPTVPVVQKKGSLWSRFTNGVKKFYRKVEK